MISKERSGIKSRARRLANNIKMQKGGAMIAKRNHSVTLFSIHDVITANEQLIKIQNVVDMKKMHSSEIISAERINTAWSKINNG